MASVFGTHLDVEEALKDDSAGSFDDAYHRLPDSASRDLVDGLRQIIRSHKIDERRERKRDGMLACRANSDIPITTQ